MTMLRILIASFGMALPALSLFGSWNTVRAQTPPTNAVPIQPEGSRRYRRASARSRNLPMSATHLKVSSLRAVRSIQRQLVVCGDLKRLGLVPDARR